MEKNPAIGLIEKDIVTNLCGGCMLNKRLHAVLLDYCFLFLVDHTTSGDIFKQL
jgi:hypothetical protein